MYIRKGISALGILFLAACATMTSDKPSVNDDPMMSSTSDVGLVIRQLNEPLLMINGSTVADVAFDVEVTNMTDQPVTLTAVSIQSVSTQPYRIGLTTRKFDRVIAPRSKESVEFWAQAAVNDFTQRQNGRSPAVLRANVMTTDAAGKKQQAQFTRQINAEYRLGVN